MAQTKKSNGFRHFKPLIDLILFDRKLSKQDLEAEVISFSKEFNLEKRNKQRNDINCPFLRKKVEQFLKKNTNLPKREEIFVTFNEQHNSRKMYYLFMNRADFNENVYFGEYLEFLSNGSLSAELDFLFHEHFIDLFYIQGTKISRKDYQELITLYCNPKGVNTLQLGDISVT